SADAYDPVGTWGGFTLPGVEGCMAYEEELFLGLSWRWRNVPKPTIAQVQGRVIGGGLMLVWPCDLIVASEDAVFSDPLVPFGVNGNEYFVHAFELGARRAKELLFLSSQLTAEEARQLGMVSRVVPREELADTVTAMARRICQQPRIGLTLAKQAVNQSQDAQGLWTAIQAAMSLHQLGHAHNREQFGTVVDPSGAETIRAMFTAEGR
ncbi:MAG TPA: enoyl-CoA hydratase-related protein, partial [Nitriliruptorales bacterium]